MKDEMVSVYVLSDVRIYGEGLSEALNRHPRVSVLGCTTDVTRAVQDIRECEPDLALIDVTITGGVSTVRAIRAAIPEVELVALAVPESAAEIFEYAEAGVSGYVTRNDSLKDLVDAVLRVASGEVVCPDKLAATLIRRVGVIASEQSPHDDRPRLTPRELEVVELVERDLSNREIAEHLCIALPTVKNHLHSIFEKLHVRRRSEAAALLRRDPLLGGRRARAHVPY